MKITILADVDGRKGINYIWNNLGLFEAMGLKIADVVESNG